MKPQNPSVLFVEDDVDLREELSEYLGACGYRVRGVGSVAEAETALVESFDLLLLDINLPDGSGLALCHRLRPHIQSGIVMCTGRSERDLRISGLKGGADAYLLKPVDPDELEATLASVLRRVVTTVKSPGGMLSVPLPAQWRLDRTRHVLYTTTGCVIELSPGETLLLARILDQPQQQLSRDALLSAFEAAGTPSDGRRLEALASRLRRKVLDKACLELPLQSVYGSGYCFTDHAAVT
jgi:DNA-binding response OmpR family regulator